MRLLLVEDDLMIGESMQQGLRQDGFAVDWVREGNAAEVALDDGSYDGVLLDLGLPRKGGMEVLKTLRSRGKAVPVLVVSARDSVSSRVEGLNLGADDYITKPFDLDELTARIRAVLRRHSGRGDGVIRVGSLALDPANHEAEIDGRKLSLSPNEFALLEVLMSRPDMVFSRGQLEQKLYGWGQEVESNTVEVFIHSLRKKIGPHFLRNIRGVGYTMSKDI